VAIGRGLKSRRAVDAHSAQGYLVTHKKGVRYEVTSLVCRNGYRSRHLHGRLGCVDVPPVPHADEWASLAIPFIGLIYLYVCVQFKPEE